MFGIHHVSYGCVYTTNSNAGRASQEVDFFFFHVPVLSHAVTTTRVGTLVYWLVFLFTALCVYPIHMLYDATVDVQGYDVGDLPGDSKALMERILNDPEAR